MTDGSVRPGRETSVSTAGTAPTRLLPESPVTETPVDPGPRPGQETHRPLQQPQTWIRELSGGNVTATPASGPVFAHPPRRGSPRPATFVHRLGVRDRLAVAVAATGWAVCFVWFWVWWLQPEHRAGWVGLVVNSALLAYLSCLPAYYLVSVLRLRHLAPEVRVPRLRVAFVVTRAPSERWELARTTLQAMLGQRYPHGYDVWLCDEDVSEEALRWCGTHGVRVSCRRDVPEYHRHEWPRRTRCKEGNLAYFYDRHGYREYDVVSQLDCDHVPHPTYLAEMVRPFSDPAIGYVAAPSVCDTNAASSWSARGRLYREAPFHGPVQLGHCPGFAPVCIGSHYAVRTHALRSIGGLGPELAEDFTTTFLFNSAGWHGAFAIDAEAHGEGPPHFAAMAVQEFQWARSLTTAFLELVPRHLPRLRGALRLRFVFVLSYYPLLALTTTAALLLPPVAAVTGLQWMNVGYADFLFHCGAMTVWMLLLTLLLRRRGLLRPHYAPVLSWENWLFVFARWPFVAGGVAAAVLRRVRPKPTVFKVTPKGRPGLQRLPLRLVLPHTTLTVMLSLAAVIGERRGSAAGYVFLCILGACAYAVVAMVVSTMHVVETARAAGVRPSAAMSTAHPALWTAAASLLPLGYALAFFPYSTALAAA